MTDPLWRPSPQRIEASNLSSLMQQVSSEQNRPMDGYDDLYRWSIEQPEQFWSKMWQFGGIIGEPGQQILSDGDKMPGARWFPEARLNFAENLLRRRDDKTALIFRTETDRRISISYAELYLRTARLASALRQHGIQPGDRIAGFMPNIIDTLVAMLATSSIGAVWSSCSPDFGINGVVDRFGQIRPRILFTTDGYLYNGKSLNSLERIQGIADRLDSVEKIIVIPFMSDAPDLSGLDNAVLLPEFEDTDACEIEFEQLPFDHPLYVMYSSGTTGVPKCIVHSAGGTLIQHLKEHLLHTDLKPDDTLFYYTTCGWMMWNWLVSGLACEATVLLYDGSPFAPGPGVLWKIAEQEQVSIFGTSAKYISALEKAGYLPGQKHDLSPLKAVLSTGSPLAHESFDYVYRDIKADLLLASISGGTDIISCFALGCPIKPVYRGELQCLGLGMAVNIFDDDGRPVRQQKGELVCTHPFPSMPIYFWDDEGDHKFRGAYFEQFDNIWAHGDYGEITEHDGLIIHGRSDAVLNPGGVRIGTAEIYRQVEKVEQVKESIAVGQRWQDDLRVVLFVVLQPGCQLDDELIKTIKATIRANTTPRHVPAKVIQVADIPRTISGKIVEVAVTKVIHNEAVKNTDALANPEALEFYRDLPELQN
ncbi:acetoacetate--CoA ligase [Motiliproteus sp.]|uniref:acetoacetate--CoA ligase n=1 Tax=Motiliproteus sp. TaxID=1898955 RepID=UPI003BACFC54